MVCADSEKGRILESEEWSDWVSAGSSAEKRWKEVKDLRADQQNIGSDAANFLADVQVRFLVAEFVRARHHLRGGDVINQHEDALGRFAFGDNLLRQTISDVCVSHGFDRKDLEDSERFPEQRDIRGEKVNVRFLACLFRLGDLLDMSSDRACPLLLNAACPIPSDSLAHWTQYQRIAHRNTSPTEIEITALCRTQDEHRVLRDWCQWIVDEASNSTILMAHARRHAGWLAPRASLDGDSPSIVIKPASTAKYVPSNWKLEIDQAKIIERLIHDAYDDPVVFIRELIQNAVDATRCRVYETLIAKGVEPPAWPTDIATDILDRYGIRIVVEERRKLNELSGEIETQQTISVEDDGLGMDRQVIERYLLQIGRSYYTSPEFRRQFPFNPTSHFGIGFLSTFAVSDEIHVDTFRPGQAPTDEALRLTLTGPRNYLLTERSDRTRQGTRVEVVMREPIPIDKVKKSIRDWCRRVEFPIVIEASGESETIHAETAELFLSETQNPLDSLQSFAIRAFPMRTFAAQGEIYVFACITPEMERWDRYSWARYTYPNLHPLARAPDLPARLICQHGISVHGRGILEGHYRNSYSYRIDVRGANIYADLSRTGFSSSARITLERDIDITMADILKTHLAESPLANGPDGWVYKQNLMRGFEVADFWRDAAQTVPVQLGRIAELMSIGGCAKLDEFATVFRKNFHTVHEYHEPSRIETTAMEDIVDTLGERSILEQCLVRFSELTTRSIFANCVPTLVRSHASELLSIRWSRAGYKKNLLGFGDEYGRSRPVYVVPFEGTTSIGLEAHETTDDVYGPALLNANHSFTKWLLRLRDATQDGVAGLTARQFVRVLSLLSTPLRHDGFQLKELETFIQPWREDPTIPDNLRPPILNRKDFVV